MTEHVVGILPAAGFGTRLGAPFPKELLPVAEHEGKLLTVLESNILQLANAGVEQAVIVIRPEKQVIKDYLGFEKFGVHLSYVHQKTMLSKEGLPDAVVSAFTRADLCVMLMGDVYFTDPKVVKQLLDAMDARRKAVAGVSTWHTDQASRFGIVDSANRWVRGVVDKPQDRKLGWHWGAVAFRFGFWPVLFQERDSFSHALDQAARSDPEAVLAEAAPGQYFDLGTPHAYLSAVRRTA